MTAYRHGVSNDSVFSWCRPGCQWVNLQFHQEFQLKTEFKTSLSVQVTSYTVFRQRLYTQDDDDDLMPGQHDDAVAIYGGMSESAMALPVQWLQL